jgi:hypothetical protein
MMHDAMNRDRGTRVKGIARMSQHPTGFFRGNPAGYLPARAVSTIRQWFRVWRWPAGLVAGLVLWIALVAVVGAATQSVEASIERSDRLPGSPGDPASTAVANAGNANVINMMYPP